MSVRCEHCGAVASYGSEIGHRSDCRRPMKVTIPVRRGHGAGHVQMEEFETSYDLSDAVLQNLRRFMKERETPHVSVPRSQYEAYRAAAKALAAVYATGTSGHDAWRKGNEALSALRASGIDLEEGK